MPSYLTQDWLDDVVQTFGQLPARSGMDATLQYVITDDDSGDTELTYYWRLRDGQLAEAAFGELDAPDFTFTMRRSDSAALDRGELDEMGAFMRGKIKFTGDMGALMRLSPVMDDPEYQKLQDELRARTAY